MDAIRTDEVEAESRVDYSADYEWLDLPAFPLQNSVCSVLGPFESPIGVRFPEVDPRTEPVVGVLAWLKGLAQEEALAGLPVTPVVAKNKGCGKVMHPAGTAW